jgi:hypothetical protein
LIRAEVNCPPRWLNKKKNFSKSRIFENKTSKKGKHKMAVEAEMETSSKQYKDTQNRS